MDYKDIRTLHILPSREYQEHQTDKEASEHRQREKPCRQDDSRRYTPEKERNVHRFFDRSPESDDGQGADHTERENDIAGHRQDQKRRDQCERHQCRSERRRIHQPAVALFIYEKNKQSQRKSEDKRQRHIQH